MKSAVLKVGKKYGALRVISRQPISGASQWLCQCDCGQQTVARGSNIKRGHTTSCGCRRWKHGHASNYRATPTYRTWQCMITRCNERYATEYKNYGGRGIKVCKRWKKFENFLKDMGERPSGKTLDRINNDGNYEPSNCRWATPKEQKRNSRTSRFIVINGEKKTIAEWAEISSISYRTLYDRIRGGVPSNKLLERT